MHEWHRKSHTYALFNSVVMREYSLVCKGRSFVAHSPAVRFRRHRVKNIDKRQMISYETVKKYFSLRLERYRLSHTNRLFDSVVIVSEIFDQRYMYGLETI